MQRILLQSIQFFFSLLNILLLAVVILSWFPALRGNRIVRLLESLTDPILLPIRKLIQRSPLGGAGMILDFSPLIAFFLLRFIEAGLISLIIQFS